MSVNVNGNLKTTWLLGVLLSILLAVGGWLGKGLADDVRTHDRQITRLEEQAVRVRDDLNEIKGQNAEILRELRRR